MTLEYEIHLPDYIAKCINKDRPELHCDGQCVLMKKIREDEKKEAKKNLVVYEYSSLYLHKEMVTFTPSLIDDVVFIAHFSPYMTSYRFNHHDPVFRPPIA